MTDRREVGLAVVGAGPAGLAAATAAAEAGAAVVVVDQASHAGGQIWRHRDRNALPEAARARLARFEASGAEHLSGAAVVDAAPGRLSVVTDRGPLLIDAHAIVLATGARELFLPFPGWTLPNVLGVGGLQALIKSGLNVAGKRVVIAGSGPLLLPVAATAAGHGAEVVAVCEQAPLARVAAFAAGLWRAPAKLADAARYRRAARGARFRTGWWIARAEGSAAVERVTLTDGRREWRVPCDLVAAAAGLVPNVELGAALGCRIADGALAVDRDQRTSVPAVFAAGECTGVGGEDLAILEGEMAGLAAIGRPVGALHAARDRAGAMVALIARAFAPRAELLRRADADTVVCRCEDVRMGQLDPAWGARQAKLATRAGMGACQGRVCGAALERMVGWPAGTVRPPLSPARVSDLAALSGNGG
ncbi:MAG: NAD(P)/FAD-dependent oxidoreductase [Gemmatimonadota bacterium]|nr:NAD(P)/FAD-dependent oxidoreductase [Gemmatimonadota bacterium]MDE3128777.1 NAD(P)/FAD-dependent oxidoreductase [Gemmatimonadota bacterium]MDE3172963.1 NAD(P)/FAD-dependent oxidoreductase [Gemmatimonadota bacterium]